MILAKLFSLVVLAVSFVAAHEAIAPQPFAIEKRDLTKRGFAECVTRMYKDAWKNPIRPKNLNAAVCFSGKYEVGRKHKSKFVFEGKHQCIEKHGLIKDKNTYDCFFLMGSNQVQFESETNDANLHMWINPDQCFFQDHSDSGYLQCYAPRQPKTHRPAHRLPPAKSKPGKKGSAKDYKDCVGKMFTEAWKSPSRPKDLVAAMCYTGSYTVSKQDQKAYAVEGQHVCSGEQVNNAPALSYTCFFITKGNTVTFSDATDDGYLAMWRNTKVCKWDGAKLSC